MYQIPPEERLRLILRQQEELRAQAARERMATEAAQKRTTESLGMPSSRTSGSHHAWATVTHVMRALTGRHAVSRHGAVR
jgi:hypothetical protein